MKSWAQNHAHAERTNDTANLKVGTAMIGLHHVKNSQRESSWLTVGSNRIDTSDAETVAAALLLAADCLRNDNPLPDRAKIAKLASVLKEIDK